MELNELAFRKDETKYEPYETQTLSSINTNQTKEDSNQTYYEDLYLSVTESPYRVSQVNGYNNAFADDNDTLCANDSLISDVTINCDIRERTLILPVNRDTLMKDFTTPVPCDPLSLTSVTFLGDETSVNQKMPSAFHTGTDTFEGENSRSLTQQNDSLSTTSDLTVVEDVDSFGIGSLLMLSTELCESLPCTYRENTQSFKQISSVFADKLSKSDLFMSDILNDENKKSVEKGPSASKKLIFNSVIDSGHEVTLAESVGTAKSKSCSSQTLLNARKSFSEILLKQDCDATISLSEFQEELLPSMKNQLKQLMLYIKTVSDKNAVLEKEMDILERDNKELQLTRETLLSENSLIRQDKLSSDAEYKRIIYENSSLKNDIECIKGKYQSFIDSHSLCETDLKRYVEEISCLKDVSLKYQSMYNASEQERISSAFMYADKYSTLNFQFEKLNTLLEHYKIKLKCSEENSDEIKHLRLDNGNLRDDVTKLKTDITALTNQNTKLIRDNATLLEQQEQNLITLESVQMDNSTLSAEINKSKQLFSELLNLQDLCSFHQLFSILQEHFYECSMKEEELNTKKLSINELRSENEVLSGRMTVVSAEIDKLKLELNQSTRELQEERVSAISLREKHIQLLSAFDGNEFRLKNLEYISADQKLLNESVEQFLSDLHLLVGEPCDSLDGALERIKNILTDLESSETAVKDRQDKNVLYEKFIIYHCQEIYKYILQIMNVDRKINCAVGAMVKHPIHADDQEECEENGKFDTAFKELTEMCSAPSNEQKLFQFSVSELEEYFLNIKDNLTSCMSRCVLMTENNLSYFNNCFEKLKQNHSDSVQTLQSRYDDTKISISILQKNQNAAVPCSCEEGYATKIKELTLAGVDKNSQIASQQLQIDNLTSRFRIKCLGWEDSRKKIFELKTQVMILEQELKERKEVVKPRLCDAGVQCKEEKQKIDPLPPPNFVQMCKISELVRKVEQFRKANMSLKDSSQKKDEKIRSLSEELDKFTKTLSLRQNRTALEDKTNINIS